MASWPTGDWQLARGAVPAPRPQISYRSSTDRLLFVATRPEGASMARRQVRRETEIFSISFLDCITCGLGSVVLLLVLRDMRSPQIEQDREELQAQLIKLQDELVDIHGQSEILNRDLTAKQEQLSDIKERIARLQGDLSDIRGKYEASKRDADVANQLEG